MRDGSCDIGAGIMKHNDKTIRKLLVNKASVFKSLIFLMPIIDTQIKMSIKVIPNTKKFIWESGDIFLLLTKNLLLLS